MTSLLMVLLHLQLYLLAVAIGLECYIGRIESSRNQYQQQPLAVAFNCSVCITKHLRRDRYSLSCGVHLSDSDIALGPVGLWTAWLNRASSIPKENISLPKEVRYSELVMSKVDTSFCLKACHTRRNSTCATMTRNIGAIRSCCNIHNLCVPHELKERVTVVANVTFPTSTSTTSKPSTTSPDLMAYDVLTENNTDVSETRVAAATSHELSQTSSSKNNSHLVDHNLVLCSTILLCCLWITLFFLCPRN